MSLELLEPYEAGLVQRWQPAGAATANLVSGRTGNCLEIVVSVSNDTYYLARGFSTANTYTVGFAFKINVLPLAGAHIKLWWLMTASTLQTELRLNTTGTLSVICDNVILGTTSQSIIANTWYYLEWSTYLHATAGTSIIKLNGSTTILNLTGKRTAFSYDGGTGIGTADGILHGVVGWGGTNNSPTLYFDDGYVATDGTFRGDRAIRVRGPDGDGTYSEWTPTGGGAHYTQVDEAEPNGNTDYVESNTLNQRDTYTVADIPTTDSVKAVQWVASCEKLQGGTRTVAPLFRISAADYVGSDLAPTTLVYSDLLQVWETNAPDGAGWTAAKFNAMEVGGKLTN